jgi:hypothetical protein
LSKEAARQIRGLFFDLDDTLLTHGQLTKEAYEALWRLHDAKIRLVAVTGRPSGWGEVLARQWPIDGVVSENGAIALVKDKAGRGIERLDSCSAVERASRRERLADLVQRVRVEVPEAELADDVHARISDVTWDIGERCTLPDDRVRAIARIVVRAGGRTTRSSVHLHGSFDSDDKASGAVAFASRTWGEDVGATLATYAFVGDSGNDAACFSAFATTVGVSNVAKYVGQLSIPPKYVTTAAMGSGFAELAGCLVTSRTPP